jgi:hypothetical protein
MIQVSRYGWKIVSSTEKVLQEHIYFDSVSKAEAYIKAYISSYHCWTYTMEPLPEEV